MTKNEGRIFERKYAIWVCPTHSTGLRWIDSTDGSWKTPKKGCGKHQFMARLFDAETGEIVPTQAKCVNCAKRPRISHKDVITTYPKTRAGKTRAAERCSHLDHMTGYEEWF